MLGSGIESGHGARDYLIDVKTGNAKPLTPEGVSGAVLSPDGSKDAVTGPDGNWAVWPLDGSGLHPVPGLDSKYGVVGWSPDGNSIYAVSIQGRERILTVYRVNATTGKTVSYTHLGARGSPSPRACLAAPESERVKSRRVRCRGCPAQAFDLSDR